jgi:putative ABC transport system substrate-binding protein
MRSHKFKRREFITLLGGAPVVWPLAARAQQPGERIRRIGVLQDTAEDDPQRKKQFARFRDGLASLGWLEGRTVRIDYRFAAADSSRYQPLAKELVALQPEVILVVSTPATATLQRETTTIPIVFLGVSDPIGSGFVASLARPGGNITGLMMYEVGIAGKWLAVLKEIAPRLTRVALVAGPRTTAYDYFVRNAKVAGSSLGIEIVPIPVADAADIERGIESFSQGANGGLALPSDSTTFVHRDLVVALAARHSLPAIYAFRDFVTAGGLMSYGVDLGDPFQQAAFYIDRILRGTKPSDLPVQTPTKYETAINLRTAKALGLTVPTALLVAADETIE